MRWSNPFTALGRFWACLVILLLVAALVSACSLPARSGNPTPAAPLLSATPRSNAAQSYPSAAPSNTPLPTLTLPPVTATLINIRPAEGAAPSVDLIGAFYLGRGEGCTAVVHFQVRGNAATGTFHVYNASTAPDGEVYPKMTFLVGANNYQLVLSGKGDPANYWHEVWFTYDGTSSNRLKRLVCPGLRPIS